MRPVCGSSISLEWNRREATVDEGHHGVAATIEQVLGRAVAEVARVLHVEWDRVGAAQLVPNVFSHQRHLETEPRQAIAQTAL